MTCVVFFIGILIGCIGTSVYALWNEVVNDEDILDSAVEYVDNTPTFR